MPDPIVEKDRDDEINQQRKAEHQAEREEGSVVNEIGRAVDQLIKPLADDEPDAEELARRRVENDREQR